MPLSHHLYLLQFRAFDTKESRHLEQLPGINEIFWIGAEPFNAGTKLTTSHATRHLHAKGALTIARQTCTQVASYHASSFVYETKDCFFEVRAFDIR
jgi:hypothetical protein